MCGIVGLAGREPARDRAVLARMRDTLRHRGPDGAGEWWTPEGHVGFGHRRLAVIDLSPAGDQPMGEATGRFQITYNGEIYNHRELRAELAAAGHAFRSTSDTEVILNAYAAWGDACVGRLNGMFAFALYDAPRQRVLLARDRAGEKPLFYRAGARRLAFASELKALLAEPGCPRRIDRGALLEYLAYGFVPGDHCILAGIRKLPPAHVAVYDLAADTLAISRYWDLPPPAPRAGESAEDLVQALEEALADSVRRRMVADVPVGILLSGGLDSSLVTALAARAGLGRVRTFTIAFPGAPSYDESAHARRVAAHFGTEHTEVAAEPASLDLIPALVRQFDEPIADSSMVPTYLVSRLVRSQATVALGGDGGDELFGGYELYTRILSQSGARRFLRGPLRVALREGAGRLPPGLRGRNYALELAARPGERVAHAYLFDSWARRRLLAPGILREREGAPPPESFKTGLVDPAHTPLQQALSADFRTYLPEDILVKVDRASMLASLEVRAPWLDPRVVELAFGRVPDALKAVGVARKILPRLLGRKLLPPDFDLDRKQGFGVPLDAWLDQGWGHLVSDVLREPSADLFDGDAVRALIDGQDRGRHNTARLFALTVFELWRREYGIET